MRRILLAGLVLVLALAGFYIGWPAWTLQKVRTAIEANEPALLAQVIDFDQVRARAKPLIAKQMQGALDQLQKQAGPFGAAIAAQLKSGLGDKLASLAIDAALTPENVIVLAREGKDISRILRDISKGDASDADGSGAKADGQAAGKAPQAPPGAKPAADAPADRKPRRLTIDNVRSYRVTGPFDIELGIAHDPKAARADALVELHFSDFSWRVVAILPQF